MNKIQDTAGAQGVLSVSIYRNSRLIEETVHTNLVVGGGRAAVAALLGGSGGAEKQVTQFGVGTSPDVQQIDDTALTEQFAKPVESVTYPGDQVSFNLVLEEADANDRVIRELGLLCDDGTLFARIVRAPIVKDNTVRLEITWNIKF